MNINIYNYLCVKFFQKVASASIKFHFPKVIQYFFYKIHYNYMNHLLNPYFSEASKHISNNYSFKGHNNSYIIWMFWWQGSTNMPGIVKKCICSVKEHANGHKIILLNRDNVKKYLNIPKIIYKKVENGKLDFAHFSDILRFNVLDKYGGLWVDSTMYCTSVLDDNKYFNYLYTAGGYHNTVPKFVKGRWTEFLIGGNENNNMIKFVDNFLQLYFSRNNLVINYFLADYALDFSYNHNLGDFQHYINDIANGNNPHLFVLANLLNKPYKISIFQRITRDTNMFKLTYKKKFIKGNTFYWHIINNGIDK